MTVSVLIPFRGDNGWRSRIYDWVYRRWERFPPTSEIVVADTDISKPLNRSEARNFAFAGSKRDIIVIADADTAVSDSNLETAIQMVRDGVPWVLPYTVYYNLTREFTEELLCQEPDVTLQEPATWDHRIEQSWAGVLVMKREAFEAVGGYDPRFEGWGGEDNAFQHCLDVIVGHHQRVPGFVSHLWHPRGDADFANPEWPKNQALLQRYRRALTPGEIWNVRSGRD